MTTNQLCQYAGMVDILSAAFGGKKTGAPKSTFETSGDIHADVAMIKRGLRIR